MQIEDSSLTGNTAVTAGPACYVNDQLVDSLGSNSIDDISGCGVYREDPEPSLLLSSAAALLADWRDEAEIVAVEGSILFRVSDLRLGSRKSA